MQQQVQQVQHIFRRPNTGKAKNLPYPNRLTPKAEMDKLKKLWLEKLTQRDETKETPPAYRLAEANVALRELKLPKEWAMAVAQANLDPTATLAIAKQIMEVSQRWYRARTDIATLSVYLATEVNEIKEPLSGRSHYRWIIKNECNVEVQAELTPTEINTKQTPLQLWHISKRARRSDDSMTMYQHDYVRGDNATEAIAEALWRSWIQGQEIIRTPAKPQPSPWESARERIQRDNTYRPNGGARWTEPNRRNASPFSDRIGKTNKYSSITTTLRS